MWSMWMVLNEKFLIDFLGALLKLNIPIEKIVKVTDLTGKIKNEGK